MDADVVDSGPVRALLTRHSVRGLVDPAPTERELDLILDAALRAPDHGRLRPWRFVLIRGEARRAFGDLLVSALKARDRSAPSALAERYRAWPMLCPLLIAVGVAVRPGHPVPEGEQVMSGAAAAMNMLNAIHMLGYGGMWVTGANIYDSRVNAALGFTPPSRLIGFVTVGTPASQTSPPERPGRGGHVADWAPPRS